MKKAAAAVSKAIRKGDLERLSHVHDLDHDVACVDCGEKAQVYDHRDYNKPLEVDPVCQKCNCARGPAVGSVVFEENRHRLRTDVYRKMGSNDAGR